MAPKEIYSKKGKTVEDVILQHVIMCDLARQCRRTFMVASVDASQCYDRVAHVMIAIMLRAYKV